MRVHQLVSPNNNVVIRHSVYESIRVLTPQGAVFDSLDTEDLRNLSVACAILFDDQWEVIEQSELPRNWPGPKALSLEWCTPPTATRKETAIERAAFLGIRVV